MRSITAARRPSAGSGGLQQRAFEPSELLKEVEVNFQSIFSIKKWSSHMYKLNFLKLKF
jgi:hypothetical protein